MLINGALTHKRSSESLQMYIFDSWFGAIVAQAAADLGGVRVNLCCSCVTLVFRPHKQREPCEGELAAARPPLLLVQKHD